MAEFSQRDNILTSEEGQIIHHPDTLYSGIIVIVKEGVGFILSEDCNPQPVTKQRVFFSFENLKDFRCKPAVNTKVKFTLNKVVNPFKLSAKLVWINERPTSLFGDEATPISKDIIEAKTTIKDVPKAIIKDDFVDSEEKKKFPGLCIGRIVKIIRNDEKPPGIGFIKPETFGEKDVFFHLASVQSAGLELELGDKIAYSVGSKNSKNPSGLNFKLLECRKRSKECIEGYLHNINCIAGVKFSTEYLIGLVTCPSVWKCMGNASLSKVGIGELLVLTNKVEKDSMGLRENFRQCLEELVDTPLFNPSIGQFRGYVADATKNQEDNDVLSSIQKFLLMLIKYVPKKSRTVIALLKPFVKEKSVVENFLYNIMRQSSKSTSAGMEDMDWDELPLVPSSNEMIHGILEGDLCIQPAKPIGPYDSAHQYLETYFRLLRADCFEAMTKGIKLLLKGKLDPRDMNVYQSISLAGVLITETDSGLSLGIKVTPQRKATNWDNSSKLMFGNLVCISPSGNFKDVIWATVIDRSLLKSHNIVLLDLCSESNSVSDPEAVQMLEICGNYCLMVESPAYYKAYEPVLKALQRLDADKIPFQQELVETMLSEEPKYMQSHSTVDGNIIYENVSSKITVSEISSESEMLRKTTLDKSQQMAIKQAFKNRIAIIQGPPGTGKTFIGIKLIKLLLSIKPEPKLPLLVLTYKNHALDEFLKELIDQCCDIKCKIVRVGGRSQDPALEKCNLNELKRGIPEALYKEIRHYKDLGEKYKCWVIEALVDLWQCKQLHPGTLLESITSQQLQCLLLCCDWEKTDMPSLSDTDDEGFQIASGKGQKAKKRTMKNHEALQILKDLECSAKDFLQRAFDPEDNLWKCVQDMAHRAIKLWLPGQSAFNDTLKSYLEKMALANLDVNTAENVEIYDETDALEIERERLLAGNPGSKPSKDIMKQMIMLDSKSSNKRHGWMPELAANSKRLVQDLPFGYLLNLENLWELSVKERVLYTQAILLRSFEEKAKVFDKILSQYQKICKTKNDLENKHKVNVLKQAHVVGMTITGASINQQLLEQVRPAIIMVEEAAEVLEPQLLAAVGDWCQHLILIGDQKQLRPPVESYTLAKNYHLDVSMMERLINNDLEHSSLTMQNRMRPEFAELLLDIYPELKSNLDRVEKNIPPLCTVSTMYFWDHTCVETAARSFSNEDEATRAIKLAMFFILQNYEPKQITILGAYLGQVRLLRQKMKKAEIEHKSVFDMYDENLADDKNGGEGTTVVEEKINKVRIQTIDNYQGDENVIVIVSLVRSNANNRVGFLNTLNRRCVAQSRAKCGMYILGNRATISASRHWSKVIVEMDAQGKVGTVLTLMCPRHPECKLKVQNADDISLGSFCRIKCFEKMKCGVHDCKKLCQPTHSHARCQEMVEFIFKDCGHSGRRICHVKESEVLCQQYVPIVFDQCKHNDTKLCYQKPSEIKCQAKCSKVLSCSHLCSKVCSDECDNKQTCEECIRIRLAKEEMQRQIEEGLIHKKRIDVENEFQILWGGDAMSKCPKRTELASHGDTASEYHDVLDMVKKYVHFGEDCFPVVKQIQRVSNDDLTKKWLQARIRLFDPRYVSRKFYCTTEKSMEVIINKGFIFPRKRGNQPFGPGIFFCTDFSKFQDQPDNEKTLLLCSVLLGKTMATDTSTPEMDLQTLRESKYDSVYVLGNPIQTGSARHEKHIIYHRDQALPEYIVYFDLKQIDIITKLKSVLEATAMKAGQLKIHEIHPKSNINPENPLDIHYQIAETQFFRLLRGKKNMLSDTKIAYVEYIINPPLLQKFQSKIIEMTSQNKCEAEYVYAFHGTKPENIPNIIKNNFDLSKIKRSAYGKGIYFSEFPDVSLSYGASLLLCKVIPGKSYDISGGSNKFQLQKDYDSHRVGADKEGRGRMLVIFDPDQILPCYVINLA